MDIHEILDHVFYKTDKETGERKVSCCKLIIVVFVIFMIIGILTGGSSNNQNQIANDSNSNNNSSIDILEALDIEPFAKDTVININGDSYTIPAGYGEDIISKDSSVQNDITFYTEHYQYMNNDSRLIMIDYIYEEHGVLDESALDNVDGSWKTIEGHKGKLSQQDNYYEFVFMKNHKEIMVNAPTEKDIETILS